MPDIEKTHRTAAPIKERSPNPPSDEPANDRRLPYQPGLFDFSALQRFGK